MTLQGHLSFEKEQNFGPLPTSAVWTSDASAFYQLNAKCQGFVMRYLGRSLMTPDDPNTIAANRQLLTLAFTHPYLLHASLAVVLAYDRYLINPLDFHRSLEECYHLYKSTALFNKRLREPIEKQDKDSIWGIAAALALLSFSNPNSQVPEGSWPLKPSDPSYLEWLRMSNGKMSLWGIANPLRPDSLFRVMAPVFTQMHSPLPEKGTNSISSSLASVCSLDASSTLENNPYFNATHAVSRLLELPDSQVSVGQIEPFTRSIHVTFKILLQDKDPVALLLLYLWYHKAGRGVWWIEARARVECPSICEYLRLYYPGYNAVHAFLPGGPLADS